MAFITKRPKGYRAQIEIKGVRESKVFSTKGEASAWAAQRETEIRSAAQSGIVSGKTLQDAFDRYETEVSAHKPGHKWEVLRMAKIARYELRAGKMGDLLLSEITPDTLGQWRDSYLNDGLKGSTVNRELKLLSHIFSTAVKEWAWMTKSPTTNVRRPKEAKPRNRLISQSEINKISAMLGFNEQPVSTISGCVGVAFLFAIETAMRAGEICGLDKDSIIHDGRVAHLSKTKNGDERDVPLSKRARELLTYLPAGDTTLFVAASGSVDTLFRKARDKCKIEGLVFHDTRHEAITRLAKKISVLDLARMTGHRDIKELMTYYNETAADISAKLD